ncbi:HlyD family secretion protein [Verrucomicrobiaceae bacterium N1E253]|uniref:HlyD family secretion protein n=1 Tax=Oceaniferula marina TaxID=2748318 RepID=A0A851GE61_9BACT|nr:HlyD family secretion protein [Oceaniferula marina]NWK55833.1 HlyD family secretion protein [Oceaniferula marina]
MSTEKPESTPEKSAKESDKAEAGAEKKPAPEASANDKAPAAESKKEEGKKKDPIKFWTRTTLIVLIVVFVGHILSDKYVPYTSNARVEAYVVPLAAQVSGQLSKVYVSNNQLVEEGDKLVEIDAAKYELAVRQAQADLQTATQASDADTASVMSAQARVTEAEANLRNAQVKGERIIKLARQGAASKSRADDARSRIASSEAKLVSAKSELEKAKSNLGATGIDNAKVKQALVNLEKAQLDLHRAVVRAPSKGIIANFTVDVGHYANVGSPIMTFISVKDVWIQADMRENSLGNIESGDKVEIVLDSAPGKVFAGSVRSVGWGVSDDTQNQMGGLQSVKPTSGWLRQPQNFPVIVDFEDMEASKGFKRAGGQANVIVYTGGNPLLNGAGKIWMWTMSKLSHIY